MLFAEWFRPPRRVLTLVLSVTALLTFALGVLAWRLFDQERMLAVQHMQERLDHAVDRAGAELLDSLARESDRLAELAALPPVDAQRRASDHKDDSADHLLLLFTPQTATAFPAHRLLYSPALEISADPPAEAFDAPDTAEFQAQDYAKAIGLLKNLAASAVPAIRANALVRLARNQRKLGAVDAALDTYSQLEQLGMTRVGALPADLIARHARCELLSLRAAPQQQSGCASALAADLGADRWVLTRGAYLFYLSEARRLGAGGAAPDPRALALTEGAAALWAQWQAIRLGEASANGERSVWLQDRPVVLVWRSSPERLAGLVADGLFVERRWLAADLHNDAVRIGIDGPQGRAIVALPSAAGRIRATRALPSSQLQWNIHAAAISSDAGSANRRRLLLAGLVIVILLAVTGSYAVARAVNRELEVSRLQSDFVAAVSHEFRSPLTTMQQLSEMLIGGRVPSQERRQRYYEVIARETGRLNRLVEDLLDFGRMEAGAQRYRLQPVEAGDLVSKLVLDFQTEVEDRGYRIFFESDGGGARVHADADALRLAFHNLLDNAVKYSPESKSIWVAVRSDNIRRVSVCVRDAGIGIAPADQRRIFQKFVRGSAAKSDGIRGTGLGLAMVSHIVEAHRGEIRLVSEPGHGSTFTILLPLASGVSGSPSGPAAPESQET